jgi:tetratricopeptide (TPR) repeat protein
MPGMRYAHARFQASQRVTGEFMVPTRHPPLLRALVFLLLAMWTGGALLSAPTVVESVIDIVESGEPRMIEALLPALNADELATAERALRGYLETNPQSAISHEALGTALAFARRFDEAAISLERAVDIDPSRATAYTKLGEIAHFSGRSEQAVRYYRQAVEADPSETRAHQHLGLYYEAQGDVAAAIRHFERGLAGAPADYLGARLNLARLYAQSGVAERSIELLEPFAGDLGHRPAVHRVIGGAYADVGDLIAAVRHLHAAVRLAPGDDAAFEVLSSALAATGDAVVGIETYRDLVEAGSQRPAVFVQLGGLLLSQGHVDDALAVYLAGVEIAPADRGLMRGMSVVSLRRGDAAAALEHARAVRALGDDTPMDAFHRGLIYEQLQEPGDAEQAYRETLALEPGFWPASNNLAVILLKHGRLDEGLDHAARAVDGAGEHSAVLHTLGWAQYLANRPREAISTLERSRAAMPDVAVVNYHLGRAYADAGEIERGRSLVMRALELDPGFEYAADAHAFLAERS